MGLPGRVPIKCLVAIAAVALGVVALATWGSSNALAHGPRDLHSAVKEAPEAGCVTAAQPLYILHYQFTAATQYHPSFSARYSGQNSLNAESESATAFVTTLFADVRLWRGGELLFNPEMSGGRGLSRTLGV